MKKIMKKIVVEEFIEETILDLLCRLTSFVNYHTNSITGEKLIVIKIGQLFAHYEAYFTHDAFIDFIDSYKEQMTYKLQCEGVESIYRFIAEIITHDFVNGAIPKECDNSIIRDGLIILDIEDCKITINPMLSNTAHNIIIDSASFINNNHITTARTIIDTLLM